MPRQVELADDFRAQQRDDVRADGELEAREDLFRHRRAAEDVAALEHQHLAAGARQVGGGRQAVVAAADDDDVVLHARDSIPPPRVGAAARRAPIILRVPIGTAFHERTFALCESLNYREWSGYYAVSAYETHHEHEYNAIRNAAALIDISPLFKYRVSGPDATRLVDRVITRDAQRMTVGQVWYTPWCDEQGKVIDDGTVSRLGEQAYRWTAADPSLRWFRQNAAGLRGRDRRHLRAGRRARAAGPDVGAGAARGGGRRHRRASILPRDERAHRRRARSTSRAPDTPAISATRSGCRPSPRSRCGTR